MHDGRLYAVLFEGGLLKMGRARSVDAAIAHGYRPHDQRAFGSVFGTLSRRNLIRCAVYCERSKGHGTAGGRVWEATR